MSRTKSNTQARRSPLGPLALVALLLVAAGGLPVLASIAGGANVSSSTSSAGRRISCASELENANKTLLDWAEASREMLADSQPTGLEEAKKVLQLADSFTSGPAKRPVERLVRDLELLQRRSNRLALNAFLRTHNLRWPQLSMELAVAVDRVQQACLSNPDRLAMMALNSSFRKFSRKLPPPRR